MKKPTKMQSAVLDLNSLLSAYDAYRAVALARIADRTDPEDKAELQKLADFLTIEIEDMTTERDSIFRKLSTAGATQ